MDEARIRGRNDIYSADEFANLSASQREDLRDALTCTGCGADAYFIRQARNGRRACFGARPHGDDCELASFATDDGGSAALDETDERLNAGDVFRIDPNRARTVRHVRHDPTHPPSETGAAFRYTRRGGRNVRTSSMNLNRLLRQLVLREKFRRSDTMLILGDDSHQTVKSGCVHIHDIEDKHVNRYRVYWGVLRYPRRREDGGAWLNTGRGSPTVAVGPEELDALLDASGVDELEDLAGSFFAFMGRMRAGRGGRQYLFVDDPAWLAIRPFDEDELIN